MLLNIKSPHFSEGGTGITNFCPDDLLVYEEAIRCYGDELYVVSQHRMEGAYSGTPPVLHSLHYIGVPFPEDCGPFCRVFRQVRAEREAKRLAEEKAAETKRLHAEAMKAEYRRLYEATIKAAYPAFKIDIKPIKASDFFLPPEDNIPLSLTRDQAKALMTLLHKTGGNPETTARFYTDAISRMLKKAGIDWSDLYPARGSIYFEEK